MKKLLPLLAFIVSWKLATLVQDPCPDWQKTDEYGRASSISCAAFHGHYEFEQKSRMFQTKEEVDRFIKNAPSDVSDIKVEETK